MLKKLSQLFTDLDKKAPSDALPEESKKLAVAALLVEVAYADDTVDHTEIATLKQRLETQFGLSNHDLDALIEDASQRQKDATSLHQFTRLLHEHCDANEKFDLLVSMWKVAMADGDIDRYEEHLIRKVSELIYMPHSEFIRAKQQARDS